MSKSEKEKILKSLERRYAVSIIYDERRDYYNIYTFLGHTIDYTQDINEIEKLIVNYFGPEYFGQEKYNKLKLKLKLGEA